ncbi:MAG: type II toxin-antitoxin system Phd/YefM family antitoxin [Waddliaceae bacterium]
MDNISAQKAMDQLSELIRAATKEKQQYRITSDEGNVILMPEETYENILVTLELLSTPGLMDNVKAVQKDDNEEQLELFSHASAY